MPEVQCYFARVLPLLLLIGLFTAPRSALAQTVQKLTASDGAADDYFGQAISFSGDIALVGAYADDDHGDRSGSAYIFRYNGTQWSEEQKLTASDGAASDVFGFSVFLSGDMALVSAVLDDDNGEDSGSVYVFRYDGTQWVEEQKLTASDGAADDRFGDELSVMGDVALIGADKDDDNGEGSGSAYIFRYDGDQWVEEQKLIASDGAAGDAFGHAVSLSGDVALIGAYRDNNRSGSAYVFRYDGDQWVEEQKLTNASLGEDWFGHSTSLSGDVALIGAPLDSDNGNGYQSGSAYVFRYDGNQWYEEQRLTASNGDISDGFGGPVSLSGDLALIGSPGDDGTSTSIGANFGSAHVFRYDGTQWYEAQKLTAPDAERGDFMGYSVSISGERALVDAYLNDDDGRNSGSVYAYDLSIDLSLSARALSPLVVTPGGSIDFEYTATNNNSTPVSGDLFFVATYDDNTVASERIASGILQPGQSVTHTFTQQVPANAPEGTYIYYLSVGLFPEVWAATERLFIGVIPAVRSGGDSTEWSIRDAEPWQSGEATLATANALPSAVTLEAAYPNPFARQTTLAFALPAAGRVRLAVYDVLGREVAVLTAGPVEAGRHEAVFDAAALPSGVYLVRLDAGGAVQIQQVTVLR